MSGPADRSPDTFGAPRWPGDTRPPFKEGNQAAVGNVGAVTHGTWSARFVSERAHAVLGELLERWPWLEEADVVTCEVLVASLARHRMLDEWVGEVIDGARQAHPARGRPRTGVEAVPDRVWQALGRTEKQVLDAAGRLGMTPLDRAVLVRDASWARRLAGTGLEELDAEGRAAYQRAKGRLVAAQRLERQDDTADAEEVSEATGAHLDSDPRDAA